MAVLDKVEELRKEKGITKVFLAGALGRKSQIFQDWKEGKSSPSEWHIKALASALGTTPEYLTGQTDDKNPAQLAPDGIDGLLMRELMELDPADKDKVLAFVAGLKSRRG